MRKSRHLRLIAVTSLLCMAIAAVGCDGDKPATPTGSSASSSSGSSSGGGGEGGTGGTGGIGGVGGGLGALKVEPAVTDMIPFDATPDINGVDVFAVGLDKAGEAVINQGKMDGSAPSTALHTGLPLVAPLNIATSTDGKMLFIADPGAEDAMGNPGQIFSIPTAGGTLANLANADGYRARGLEIISENSKDVIYFAGTDPTGVGGIFKVPADNSGPVVAISTGAPLNDPSGIAVSLKGDIYACDTVQDGDNLGIVVAIKGGVLSTLATGILAGYPCGVALDTENSVLLVSALDPLKKTDVIINIDLATKTSTLLSQGIDTFLEPAGLHRAKQGGNSFAWADSAANGGTVFRVTFP